MVQLLGIAAITLALIGIVGAIIQNRLLLLLYSVVMVIAMSAFGVLAGTAFTFKTKMDDWEEATSPAEDQETKLVETFNEVYCYAERYYFCNNATAKEAYETFFPNASTALVSLLPNTTSIVSLCDELNSTVDGLSTVCEACNMSTTFAKYYRILTWAESKCPRTATTGQWCASFLATGTAGAVYDGAPYGQCRTIFLDVAIDWSGTMAIAGLLVAIAAADVRKSRNYTEREAGAYGRVAGFNAVVEPQVDGRLHLHMTVYGSSFTPEILTRGASCQELREYIAKWINAVSTNHLSPSTRAWLAERECMEPLPRACEVTLPPVSTNFAAFQDTIEASVVATNIHNHSRTCIKGKRGKTQCRLCRPAGIHNLPTQPLHISKSDGVLTGKSLNPELEVKLDAGYDPEQGEFLRPHIPGPIVWEQFRPESDGMFIETNLLLSGLTASHCNSSIMNGEDAGDMVDEYQQNYMTKEGAGLKNAAAVMLTALEDVLKYPSVALNSGTPIRQAQYLATRTVNAFGGAHEWPLSLMVYALLGHKSFISSEAFWYIFPHGYMDELRKMEMNEVNDDHDTSDSESGSLEDDEGPIGDDFDVDSGSDSADEGGNIPMTQVIEELASFAHSDDLSELRTGLSGQYTSGGARAYKVEGRTIFITQVESYKFRGEHFVDYSPSEFACIVDIVPRQTSTKVASQRGHKRRKGFELSPRHPLYHYYEAVIRTKMLTPMFGRGSSSFTSTQV
ncbi:hypothetical protein PPTG_22614 [Phytophthora nicotianae INRA-310]|uniref:Helitron helicase-like domain-containing protein n=1 Tax=Phytophthora nicotianae (strain INRA-310) TaxID=761204 RepID=W2QDK4_PHYN3|nr:hypothetical protein PPTG_22614 [Phytophthora nicotianae INRA-310]ETN10951.1 hypothetical protein PPTG_22614 [Phytophthora nicotianae INRA-310]